MSLYVGELFFFKIYKSTKPTQRRMLRSGATPADGRKVSRIVEPFLLRWWVSQIVEDAFLMVSLFVLTSHLRMLEFSRLTTKNRGPRCQTTYRHAQHRASC